MYSIGAFKLGVAALYCIHEDTTARIMTYLVDMIRNPALEQAAAQLYDSRLPYHNFGHALETLASARELVERCRDADMDIEAAIVYPAALFHDAAYHEDYRQHGYDSKEAYSAALAVRVMHHYGYANARIHAVRSAILSTECGVACESIEARLVRAADLSGLGTSYRLFIQNALRLWREDIILSGRDVSWDSWRDQAVGVLEQFLDEDLGLSPACYAPDGEAWLNKHGRENLERLRCEPFPATGPAAA